MNAETIESAGDLALAGDTRPAGEASVQNRAFHAALTVALLMHASLLLGVGRSAPRVIGEENGSLDAVSVSLVTESEFREQSAPATPPPGAPARQSPAESTAKAVPPPAPPPSEAAPANAVEPAPPQPPDLKPSLDSTAEEKAQQAPSVSTLENEAPDLFALPETPQAKPPPKSATRPEKPPEAKPQAKAETKPDQPAAPKKPAPQQTAKLDEAEARPSHTFSAPPVDGGGREGAFVRPPGITKSGWNDAFAKGVVHALQLTMPQMRALGRVTVRILLDENGNVRDVIVVKPSTDANLNQSVVFAARQTSYPIPPAGSTVADRTFLITYIYR